MTGIGPSPLRLSVFAGDIPSPFLRTLRGSSSFAFAQDSFAVNILF
jgi:hypothetical protein